MNCNVDITQLIEDHPFIIWDLDGTIIDSMPYWDTLGFDYLRSLGITPPENLLEIIDPMTLEESAAYFRDHFGIEKEINVIIAEVMAFIEEEYRSTIPAKSWASEMIKAADAKGCRMCVLTTSDAEMAKASLARNGLLSCMERIITSTHLQMDKRSGAIYEKACNVMGYDIEKTLICEDAIYAVRAASETKAHVLAVSDTSNQRYWKEIKELADYSVE